MGFGHIQTSGKDIAGGGSHMIDGLGIGKCRTNSGICLEMKRPYPAQLRGWPGAGSQDSSDPAAVGDRAWGAFRGAVLQGVGPEPAASH